MPKSTHLEIQIARKKVKDRASIEAYIESGIFAEEHGRYRQTAKRPADIIILSRDGWAYGHFHIRERVAPAPEDRERVVTSSYWLPQRLKS
jgi:hypothetical protein